MATFEAQVEGLTSLSIDGSSAPTQTELTQFLTDGAKEVINLLPEGLLPLCSSSVSFTSGSASTLNTGKVLHVLRSDGDISQPCRSIPAMYKGKYSDPDDMNYATVTDPAFYVENNTIDVLPAGGSCTYSEVQYPAVAYGDSAIAVFPDEAEYLVALYASIKTLQNAMGNKTGSLPADISFPSIPITPTSPSFDAGAISVSSSAPTYTKVSLVLPAAPTISNLSIDSVLPVAPSAPSFDTGAISISSSAPTYTKTSLVLSTAPTISDLNINSVLPSSPAAPSFDAGAISVSSSAPTYTKPALVLETAPSISDLSIKAIQPTSPSTPSFSTPTISAITVSDTTVGTMPTISNIGVGPTYTKPTITTRVSFEDFWEAEEDSNPFGDSDPGVFSISTVAPASPATPTISYSNAFIGNAVSAAQDAITQAVDSITHGPTDAAGTSDSDAPSDATASTASAYTAVTVGGASEQLTAAITSGTIGTDADFQDVSDWWEVLGHMIEDEEDLEMANSQVSKITAYINAFQAQIQNNSAAMQATIEDARQATQASIADAANDVSTNNASMQTQVQASIANASNDVNASISKMQQSTSASIAKMQQSTTASIQQMQQSTNVNIQNAAKALEASIQDYSLELQKYQADVSKYQQEINKDIQEYSKKLERYQLELTNAYKAWEKTESDSLQQYQIDIQNELNEFNKENANYQVKLQEAVQQAQIDKEKVTQQAQISSQTKLTQSQLDAQDAQQEATLKLQKEYQEYQSKLNKYSNEVQLYQAQVNKEVQEYQKNLDADLRTREAGRQTDKQK